MTERLLFPKSRRDSFGRMPSARESDNESFFATFLSPSLRGGDQGVVWRRTEAMTKIFNRKIQKQRRQYLRNSVTNAEAMLWLKLKGKQLRGYKFRRQQGVEQYIVDFYCPEYQLTVEIDGATHSTREELERDKRRQNEIEKLGIQFLRFTNTDIYENLDGVLQTILDWLKQHQPPLTPP